MHNNYSVSLGSKHLPLHINPHHYSLFWIGIFRLWRQMLLIFHPASYIVMTVDHSLSSVTASKFVDIDCACKSCDLEIMHVMIMQSLD